MTAGGRTATGTLSMAGSIEEIGRAEWTDLVDTTDAPVFYAYDFLASVEQQPLTTPSQAFYLLARDAGGRLTAALPVYLQRTRDPFGAPDSPPVRALISHVWHCYDSVLPSRQPLTPALVGQFWTALGELAGALDAQLWGLVNVSLQGPLAAALSALGVPLEETTPRYQRPVTAGPVTLDDHLIAVSRASRRTLRKYLGRADRAGTVRTLAPGRDALDSDVLDLCLATADKHAPGYYPPVELAALVHRLGPECQILRLDLDGVLLAASICLFDRSRMHAWAGGCVYLDELNWSPQYVLFGAELEAGFASGKPMLECGRRNDEFKRRYGLSPHPLGRAVRRRGEAG